MGKKNILITAAEEEELITAKQALMSLSAQEQQLLDVDFMLTGIGSVSTTYRLTKQILSKPGGYNLALNIGIAGSFNKELPLGSVARISHEYFGDLGFETFTGFQTLFDYSILDADTIPFKGGALVAPKLHNQIERALAKYPSAPAVTVQTVSGLPHKRELLEKQFNPQIESMEGAAFFYVLLLEGIPFAELRSVSNEVGERDRSKWNIPMALDSLRDSCSAFFNGVINSCHQ